MSVVTGGATVPRREGLFQIAPLPKVVPAIHFEPDRILDLHDQTLDETLQPPPDLIARLALDDLLAGRERGAAGDQARRLALLWVNEGQVAGLLAFELLQLFESAGDGNAIAPITAGRRGAGFPAIGTSERPGYTRPDILVTSV